MLHRQAQRQGTAEAVAHQRHPLEVEGVEEGDQLIDPRPHRVVDAVRPLREPEADHVGGVDVTVLGQPGNGEPPVGIRGHPRPRAVDEHHGWARSRFEVVRLDTAGVDQRADLGPLCVSR